MFPNDNTDVIVEKVAQDLKTAQNVLNSFDFDAQKKEYTIKDGSPVLVDELEATKQWIRRFLATDINTLEIYEGYKFGTSYKKLLGSKIIFSLITSATSLPTDPSNLASIHVSLNCGPVAVF